MAARAVWKGQIRLALVSIPVELYPAAKSGASISFRQIHEPTGKPIRYEKVVPGVGPVDRDEILKGYEYEKGSYVLLSPEEIDAVKLESKRTLELTQFVELGEIPVFYFEKPYFVAPQDELAEEAYTVLRDALKASGKVGLGQLAMRGKETLVSVRACGRGLVIETLRYADEVRNAESYFASISDDEPQEELLELAETLIEKKTAPFDAKAFEDRYAEALHDLIDKKLQSKSGKVDLEEGEEAPASRGNVVDLMAALKQSVEGGEKPKRSRKKKAASG
ncbi:Ku protein [Pacificimonas flava]|uniref:Non-homologous end joining protein Ku n=2 Tax=Pacificimonas TaxID=1960290 RepID=A0A219B245_9SPHN|nr:MULTISPECIES: Ku protein [Pacificimonas]MBZ6377932.1 Ku protein [Pacificimonas aurantium]OWV32411.1 Ku protein [Pacificimonas flava]